MAELADALASGASDRKVLGVRIPLSAQRATALLHPSPPTSVDEIN